MQLIPHLDNQNGNRTVADIVRDYSDINKVNDEFLKQATAYKNLSGSEQNELNNYRSTEITAMRTYVTETNREPPKKEYIDAMRFYADPNKNQVPPKYLAEDLEQLNQDLIKYPQFKSVVDQYCAARSGMSENAMNFDKNYTDSLDKLVNTHLSFMYTLVDNHHPKEALDDWQSVKKLSEGMGVLLPDPRTISPIPERRA